MLANHKKSNKMTIGAIITLILVSVLLVGLPSGFLWGSSSSYNTAQMAVWDNIANDGNNLRSLFSNDTQSELKQWLPNEPMNFTDGLIWESHLLNFSYDRPAYQNISQVLENGKGACGEFTWVYAAFCAVKDIPFRVIHVGYFIPGVTDHSWVQVNPSKDGKTWIQVEVAGSCDGIQKGETMNQLWNVTLNNDKAYLNSHYKLVLAYQLIDNQVVITDVTSTFS